MVCAIDFSPISYQRIALCIDVSTKRGCNPALIPDRLGLHKQKGPPPTGFVYSPIATLAMSLRQQEQEQVRPKTSAGLMTTATTSRGNSSGIDNLSCMALQVRPKTSAGLLLTTTTATRNSQYNPQCNPQYKPQYDPHYNHDIGFKPSPLKSTVGITTSRAATTLNTNSTPAPMATLVAEAVSKLPSLIPELASVQTRNGTNGGSGESGERIFWDWER